MAGLGFESGTGQGTRRGATNLGESPSLHFLDRQVGHVDVEHRRGGRQIGYQGGNRCMGHPSGGSPQLPVKHLVDALALHPPLADGLADRHPADPSVTGRQGGADRPRVVYRPPHIAARIDS